MLAAWALVAQSVPRHSAPSCMTGGVPALHLRQSVGHAASAHTLRDDWPLRRPQRKPLASCGWHLPNLGLAAPMLSTKPDHVQCWPQVGVPRNAGPFGMVPMKDRSGDSDCFLLTQKSRCFTHGVLLRGHKGGLISKKLGLDDVSQKENDSGTTGCYVSHWQTCESVLKEPILTALKGKPKHRNHRAADCAAPSNHSRQRPAQKV